MVMNGYKLLIMVNSGNCSNPPFINIYLVGGLEHEFYDFPTLGIVTPTDDSYFSEGQVYHQRVLHEDGNTIMLDYLQWVLDYLQCVGTVC